MRLLIATRVLGGTKTCCLCHKLTLVVSYDSTINFPLTRFAKRLTAIDQFPLFFVRRVPWAVATDLPPFLFFYFFSFLLFVKGRTVTSSRIWIDLPSPRVLVFVGVSVMTLARHRFIHRAFERVLSIEKNRGKDVEELEEGEGDV